MTTSTPASSATCPTPAPASKAEPSFSASAAAAAAAEAAAYASAPAAEAAAYASAPAAAGAAGRDGQLRSLELFCGAGGLALGLQQAGFAHEYLFERDGDCCQNIRANIEGGCSLTANWQVRQADVREIRWQDLGIRQGELALISGGPPCQPFSAGGRGRAHNDVRDMFPEAVKAVRELQPQAFIFENVQGLLRPGFAPYFKYILLQLAWPSLPRKADLSWEEHLNELQQHDSACSSSREYRISYSLLNAADYGVPQVRQRVFITGLRADLGMEPQLPQPTHCKEALLHAKLVDGSYWRRHGLPVKSSSGISAAARDKVISFVEKNPHLKPWQTTRDATGALPDPCSPEARLFNSHEFRPGARAYPGHTGSELDAPSKTIKAGVHGVPGGENMVNLDDGSLRYFTVRESARIQTFPDSYHFHRSWTESMRQIGNAVPVALAYAVGAVLFRQLKEHCHGKR